jgi:hypothetical protein
MLLLAPPYLIAGPASNHYPNDIDAVCGAGAAFNACPVAGGGMTVELTLTGPCADVTTPFISIGGPTIYDTGEEVATLAARGLCLNAKIGHGYTCTGTISGDPNVYTDCFSLFKVLSPGDEVTATCKDSAGAGCGAGDGFTIEKTEVDVIVTEVGGKTGVGSLVTASGAGNTVGTDLRPNWLVRVNPVDPNGVRHDGIVTFGITRGASTETFTIDTTGKDDAALHAAIVAGYASLPNTLHCVDLVGGEAHAFSGGSRHVSPNQSTCATDPNCHDDETCPIDPNCVFASAGTDVYGGPFVYCAGVTGKESVTQLSVRGVPGQQIVMETTANLPQRGAIPALSVWGMALLVGILLLTGAWLLRRRRAGQLA